MKKINLVLADDHLMILEGLKALLKNEEHLHIQACFQSGDQVLKYLKVNSLPDILILDINMPEIDGIDLTGQLKSLYPSIKILILSMYNRNEFVSQLFKLGADGYIMKNSNKQVILSAIEALNAGERYFSHLLSEKLPDDENNTNSSDNNPILSDREKEVVKLLTKGLNSQAIAEELQLSYYTIDSHRRRILAKINGNNAADIIRFAIKTGIVKDYRL